MRSEYKMINTRGKLAILVFLLTPIFLQAKTVKNVKRLREYHKTAVPGKPSREFTWSPRDYAKSILKCEVIFKFFFLISIFETKRYGWHPHFQALFQGFLSFSSFLCFAITSKTRINHFKILLVLRRSASAR